MNVLKFPTDDILRDGYWSNAFPPLGMHSQKMKKVTRKLQINTFKNKNVSRMANEIQYFRNRINNAHKQAKNISAVYVVFLISELSP